MKELIKQALDLYKQEIEKDKDNTDAIFFIIEELGSDLNETEFETFNNEVMKIEKLRNELLLENENVTFVNEDAAYFYYNIQDEFFTGTARVEKSEDNTFTVDYKEDGQQHYRGNGIIEL